MMPGLALPILASGGGVTPDAVNWANISAVETGVNAAKSISGISQTILLRMAVSGVTLGNFAFGTVAVIVNGASAGNVSVGAGGGDTLDFSAPPEAEIYFSALGSSFNDGWSLDCTITVSYRSTGAGSFDTTLDTFTVALTD